MPDIAHRFSDPRPIILDGATSTELERRGVPMDTATWSGLAALSHPAVLRDLHADYLRAGAEVIIANTYAAAPHHLAAAGFGDRAREINVRSVELALEARDAAADGPAWVAGSLSLMAPGFHSANRPAPAEHAEQLRVQAEWVAEAGVDLLAVEMLRDVEWSAAAMDAALSVGLPVWAGFSCVVDEGGALVTPGSVAGPTPLEDVLRAVAGRGEALVAIMHSKLKDTGPGLECARRLCEAPLGAWPNSGHFEPPHWQFQDVVAPGEFAAMAARWVEEGVRVVGGCCGLGPEHVRAAAERLRG